MIRSILVIFFFFVFFVFGLPVVGILFLIRRNHPEKSSWATRAIIREFLRFELWVSGTKVEAEGLDNIPDDEACLFVGNHQSYYDILCTYIWMKRPTGFIAKKETRLVPVMGWWMILLNCLFLDRSNIRQGLETIKKAIEYVEQGTSIFIYPEGTRNKNKDKTDLNEFKEGSLRIAQRAGCKVVPVAISGTADIYENHKPFVRSAKVKVVFCEPFRIADLPKEQQKKSAAYCRDIIMRQLKGPDWKPQDNAAPAQTVPANTEPTQPAPEKAAAAGGNHSQDD